MRFSEAKHLILSAIATPFPTTAVTFLQTLNAERKLPPKLSIHALQNSGIILQIAIATPLPEYTPPNAISCYNWTGPEYGLFDHTNVIRADIPSRALDAIVRYLEEGDAFDEIKFKVSYLPFYDVDINDILQVARIAQFNPLPWKEGNTGVEPETPAIKIEDTPEANINMGKIELLTSNFHTNDKGADIIINKAYIHKSLGSVDRNLGVIMESRESVGFNHGHIESNYGTIHENYGHNYGTIVQNKRRFTKNDNVPETKTMSQNRRDSINDKQHQRSSNPSPANSHSSSSHNRHSSNTHNSKSHNYLSRHPSSNEQVRKTSISSLETHPARPPPPVQAASTRDPPSASERIRLMERQTSTRESQAAAIQKHLASSGPYMHRQSSSISNWLRDVRERRDPDADLDDDEKELRREVDDK
ncbi:MAG: hypothetical protein MMC33_003628 [Icmadophila ericetorum]|nr:hypothetical protein [Icmadophila ericetorum]